MTARGARRAALALAVIAVVPVHLAIASFARYANVDEAYGIAIGERLNEGFKLYEGAVSQRGPLMYYLFALIARVFGWDSLGGIRAVALAVALAHLALVYWIGERLIGRWVGALAAVVSAYAIGFGFPTVDGVALNGETLLLPLLLVGIAVSGVAMLRPNHRARRWLLVAAGVAFGAAIAIKPSAALHPAPLVVWMVLRARSRARLLVDLAIYSLAVAAPMAAFLAHAAAIGTLKSLWYYCVTYNLSVHKRAAPEPFGLRPLYDHLGGHTAYFALVVLACAASLPRLYARARAALGARSARALGRGFGVRAYVGLHAVAALALASALPQQFAHYYVPATPLLALLVAAPLPALLTDARLGAAARRLALVVAGFVAAIGVVLGGYTVYADGLVTHDANVGRAAAHIEGATRPDQRIFVWGFSPWLYGYAHRRPAGRFVFETYVTGFVPLYWEALATEPSRAVPGAMDALLADLDREQPELVIDAGSLMIARPMRAYPKASAWLHAGYCFESRVGAFDLYRRKKTPDASCPTAYFPCPHPPVDHWNRPLHWVTMPPVVDADDARVVPGGDWDPPHAFGDATPLQCPR